MSEQEQTQAPDSPQEASTEDIIATLRGEDIADEVDKPPPRARKAVQAASPEPTQDTEEEESASTDDSDASDEEEDDESGFGFLRKAADAKMTRLQAQIADLEAQLNEVKPKAKRGEMRIQDLIDDDEGFDALSKEDKTVLIERIFADLYPDRATPEVLADVQRAKYAREQKKAQAILSQKEQEMQAQVAAARIQEQVAGYRADVREYIADNRDKYPTVFENFGSTKNAAEAVMKAAEFIATRGDAESDADIDPARILALMEEEFSSNRKKSQKQEKPTQRTRNKQLPVSAPVSEDDELDEYAAIMRGERG